MIIYNNIKLTSPREGAACPGGDNIIYNLSIRKMRAIALLDIYASKKLCMIIFFVGAIKIFTT